MEASFSPSATSTARMPLSQFGKLTIAALAGITGLLVYGQAAIFGGFNPVMSAVAAVPLVAAGILFTGRRWAALPAAIVCALLLALLAMLGGEVVYTLAHPGGAMFSFMLLALTLVVLGLAGGVGATIQNYRRGAGAGVRWLPATLALVAGLVLGALLVANIPQASAPAGVSAEALAGLPAVTLDKFDNGEIRVKAGDTVALRLENPDGVAHAFVVDDLGVNAPMPAGENSLAFFKPVKPGTYTFYCTPHYDKASGEGMHGTLVVE